MSWLLRRFFRLWVRAAVQPAEPPPTLVSPPAPLCYVLDRDSMADLAVLVVIDGPGTPRVEVSHIRPSTNPLLEREVRVALDAITTTAMANAREGRYARWVPTVTDAAARFVTQGDRRLVSLLHTFDVRSLMVVALRSGGRSFGALALARSESPGSFRGPDYATAGAVRTACSGAARAVR